jgi:hypothetical protein
VISVEFSKLLTMINSLFIAPSTMDRSSELETRPGIEYQEQGDVIPNLSTLAGTLIPSRQGGGQIFLAGEFR